MANKLLNLCLDVVSAPVVVTLQPIGGGGGKYHFEVFDHLDSPPVTTVIDQRVTLDRAGPYRVVAWDDAPPPWTPALFREPTWIDPLMSFSLTGSGLANVVSASIDDPWPPN